MLRSLALLEPSVYHLCVREQGGCHYTKAHSCQPDPQSWLLVDRKRASAQVKGALEISISSKFSTWEWD